jgi:hypothetical protein
VRVWLYEWDSWRDYPRFGWWYRFVPSMGEDERGYRTLVFPVPFICHVVVALWYCGCSLEDA